MGMERMTDVGCGGEGEEEKRKRASFLWVEKAAEETQGQPLETQKMLENTGKRDGKNDRCRVWWKGWRMRKGKEGEIR